MSDYPKPTLYNKSRDYVNGPDAEKWVLLVKAWLKSDDGFEDILRFSGWTFFTCLSSLPWAENTILHSLHGKSTEFSFIQLLE